MCYRYSNTKDKLNPIIEERLLAEQVEKAYFYHANAFDKGERPVITQQEPDKVSFFRWGLIPHWVKTADQASKAALSNANARSETVFELPSFRSYVPNRRCIVPATGFYEHRHVNTGKAKPEAYPYYIEVLDENKKPAAFFFAGIYSKWEDQFTFSILTTHANSKMEYIHNNPKNPHRMPVILSQTEALTWLHQDLPKDEMKRLFEPYPSDGMQAHTVSKEITSRTINPDRAETTIAVNHNIPDLAAQL
ncbi:MAG: SOS response-associated peptidase [Bacteroidetes bacterium]|nr:SOS response-associated peptidase [Bacteroidota bacterium]